jgi:hypothetical protein
MAGMKIETTPIDKLVPYVNNARTHSPEQVDQIAASIKEFGFNNPVLIDKKNGIIAGHGRVQAARKLELKEVPTVRLEHLTETQKKAFIIADNKIAMNAGWDDELLALELKDLDDVMFDLNLTGFDAAQINEMFNVNDYDDFEPNVPDGEKMPLSNMTFTVSAEQLEVINTALNKASKEKPFDPQGVNENKNGNALFLMALSYGRQ